MIFRSNAILAAIIILEMIFAAALTHFAFDLQATSSPAPSAPNNPAHSSQAAPDDYIVIVAANFQIDHDIAQARDRLALFQEDDITDRVTQLALSYSSQKKRQAVDLAVLAVALGSEDQNVAQIALNTSAALGASQPPVFTGAVAAAPTAASLGSATPYHPATLTRAPSTSTRKPTATTTRTATATATTAKTTTPASTPTSTQAASTATSTVAPSTTPTLSPTSGAASPVGTAWQPDRSQWPPATGYQLASTGTGQPYWHLVRATYCDYMESNYNCPNLPGGPYGWGTYVMLIDSQGSRTEAPLLFNGTASGLEQKSAADMCNCNYSFSDSGINIQVGGAASDGIAGLDPLYSVKVGLSHFHVRYFLTFQLSTK